nr:UbiD family decarboxylase [Bauldia sp.]
MSMRDYMERLRARGDLLVVDREIDPFHELAAVTHVAMKTWGKAILFTNVKGTRFPVVTNLYGTRERLAGLIGIQPGEFCRQWSNLAALGGAAPKDALPLVDVDDDLVEVKLSDLPLITYSDRDAAPYFTSAMFIAKEPETGVGNLSFHRSMYVSDSELRCRLAPRHHLTLYHEKAEKMGKPL